MLMQPGCFCNPWWQEENASWYTWDGLEHVEGCTRYPGEEPAAFFCYTDREGLAYASCYVPDPDDYEHAGEGEVPPHWCGWRSDVGYPTAAEAIEAARSVHNCMPCSLCGTHADVRIDGVLLCRSCRHRHVASREKAALKTFLNEMEP